MDKGVGLIILAILVAALLGLFFLMPGGAPEEVVEEEEEEEEVAAVEPEAGPAAEEEEEPTVYVPSTPPDVEGLNLTFAVPIVAVIVVIFIALMSMLAASTADPRLEAWVKTEIRELIAGAILIAIITTYFLSSDGITRAIIGESNYIELAEDILDEWIGAYDRAFRDIIRAATIIRYAATFSTYTNVPMWYFSLNYSVNPLGGIAMILGPLNLAAQALTNAIFISEGIRLLISFLKVTVPVVIMPLAFILRLIPFTRRVGNTMISISLAAIIFLPFSVILADALNDTIPPEERPNPDIVPKAKDCPDQNPGCPNFDELDDVGEAMMMFEPVCEAAPVRLILSLGDLLFATIVCLPLLFIPIAGPGLYVSCWYLVKEVIYPLIMTVFQIGGALLLLMWEGAYGTEQGQMSYVNTVFGQIQPFLEAVTNLVFLGYLDFILIALVTFAGARSISAAIGGEWYMAGIQRLI